MFTLFNLLHTKIQNSQSIFSRTIGAYFAIKGFQLFSHSLYITLCRSFNTTTCRSRGKIYKNLYHMTKVSSCTRHQVQTPCIINVRLASQVCSCSPFNLKRVQQLIWQYIRKQDKSKLYCCFLLIKQEMQPLLHFSLSLAFRLIPRNLQQKSSLNMLNIQFFQTYILY